MTGTILHLEHSVDSEVARAFAWKYRTDVANWNDPPARFVLDGPFIEGARGTTLLPEQPPLQWTIREVRPPLSFVIEMQLDGALLTFEWSFDALSEHKTRMTQRIVLAGDNAEKKNGLDALYATVVEIDEDVREEYWVEIRNQPEMKKKRFFKSLGKYSKW
jgi:hypothetical protein